MNHFEPKPNLEDSVTLQKEYIKPLIERVELKIDEAVLVTGCKLTSNSNGLNGTGNPCNIVAGNSCFDSGS